MTVEIIGIYLLNKVDCEIPMNFPLGDERKKQKGLQSPFQNRFLCKWQMIT